MGGGARGDIDRGLTPLGRDFCLETWARGFLLDCAHCNHKTILDIVELAHQNRKTVHYTHGFLDQPAIEYFGQRGLPRNFVSGIVESGGLVGLSPHPGFVGYYTRFLEEVAYLAEHVPQHGVLGSDFTGITLVEMSRVEAAMLLDEDVGNALDDARRLFPAFGTYPHGAKLGILDMLFNLGQPGLFGGGDKKGFPNFLVAVEVRDWRSASRESHRLTEQVGEARNRIVRDWFLDALAEEQEFVDPRRR